MTTSIESVTAASKLRREKDQVQIELTEKRKACKELMERVRQKEEALRAERAELQEQLVKFYKYIQDNEMKRAHHNKKALGEERAKQERHVKILELSEQVKQLEKEKIEVKRRVARLTKYETYLTDVLQHNDSEDFTEAGDLIERFKKLDAHRSLLKLRQEQLQEELAKAKVSLALRHQRNKAESMELDSKVNEMQIKLTSLQRDVKEQNVKLDDEVRDQGDTKRHVGQMRMACGNLYDRCVAILREYRGGRVNREETDDMLQQLTIIGDCLADLVEVTKQWAKKKEKQQEEAAALFSPQRRQLAQQQHQQQQSPRAAASASAGHTAAAGSTRSPPRAVAATRV
jgi:hypothetical protein